MSEFYDLDKEETLYNYIIGTLTTIKAREKWDKETQRYLFKNRIPNFLYTLRWSSRDTLEKINLGEKLSGVMTLRTFSMSLTWRF